MTEVGMDETLGYPEENKTEILSHPCMLCVVEWFVSPDDKCRVSLTTESRK